jgi:hypothetical protein
MNRIRRSDVLPHVYSMWGEKGRADGFIARAGGGK